MGTMLSPLVCWDYLMYFGVAETMAHFANPAISNLM
jgi:hypothetical protein